MRLCAAGRFVHWLIDSDGAFDIPGDAQDTQKRAIQTEIGPSQ